VLSLKHILYYALLPQFLRWSKGFPLSIEECELRNKNWVQLIPRQPDIDAIAERFFEAKPKSKVKVFSAKKGADLSLCVKNEKYQEILQHLVDLDEAGEEVGTPVSFCVFKFRLMVFQVLFAPKHNSRSLVRTNRTSTQNEGKKRKLSDSETHEPEVSFSDVFRHLE
jgi:hypothetical protein